MKNWLCMLLMLLFVSNLLGQNVELSVCKKDSLGNAYYPNMMFEWINIYAFEDTFKRKISEYEIIYKGLKFLQVTTSKNNSINYFNVLEKDGEELLYDESRKQIRCFIPSSEIEGHEILNVFNLDYRIAGYHVRVKTPVCEYNDAIMVLSKRTGSADFSSGDTFYYVRGIGFVAREYRGIITGYISRRYILKK